MYYKIPKIVRSKITNSIAKTTNNKTKIKY